MALLGRPGDVGLVWRLIGGAGPVVVAVVSAPNLVPAAVVGPGVVAGVIMTAAFFGVSEWRGRQARRTIASLQEEGAVADLLGTALAFLGARGGKRVRANVMTFIDGQNAPLPNEGDARGLQMTFRSARYSQLEQQNIWKQGKGCAGMAWEKRTRVLGGKEGEMVESVGDTYPVDITKMRGLPKTKETIKCVFSVPLNVPPNPRLIGVLNFDDELALRDSVLSDVEILRAIDNTAQRVQTLMAVKAPASEPS